MKQRLVSIAVWTVCTFLSAASLWADSIHVGAYHFQPYFDADKVGKVRGIWKDLLEKNLFH